MSLALTIFFFIVLLSFLVLIHEAGHFLAAKLFGVKVHEFGLGYPPLARKLFSKWGTVFTLNWLPFGGFVRLAGEERGSIKDSQLTKKERQELFYAKNVFQRLVIILAGAVVNFAFGVVAFATMFTFLGIPETSGIVVSEVMEGTPAAQVGLPIGVRVIAVTLEGVRQELTSVDDFIAQVSRQSGKKVVLEYEKEGIVATSELYVRRPDEVPQGQGALGVAITPEKFEFVKYPSWQMPFRGAVFGLKEASRFGWEILKALGDMVRNLIFSGQVPQEVGGPVRIVYEAQQANLLKEGPLAILNFAAILSINLAMVNALPIPALDGGRAFFVILEGVMGKRFKPSWEQYGNAVGMLVLLTLIVLISFRDVGMIFSDNGLGWEKILEKLRSSGT